MLTAELSILITDDSRAMRRIIRHHLQELSFTDIREAPNGQAAWDILQQEHFHLVISDWYMPRMKGIELLRKIRSCERLGHMPFLMVTAEARKANLVEAVQCGVSGYMTKPFTLDDMRSKLAKIMAKPSFSHRLKESQPAA